MTSHDGVARANYSYWILETGSDRSLKTVLGPFALIRQLPQSRKIPLPIPISLTGTRFRGRLYLQSSNERWTRSNMGVGHENSESELIRAAQAGDRIALDVLVRRHDGWVRHIVYATTGRPGLIDDVAQTVWAGVWQQISTLSDPTRWRGWLYRMARNAAIDAGKKASRERDRLQPSSDDGLPADRNDPAMRIAETEEQARILRAIKGLPEIYREPFILRHLEEWSYAEIGDAMGIPRDTVETRLVRARRLLREALPDLARERRISATK